MVSGMEYWIKDWLAYFLDQNPKNYIIYVLQVYSRKGGQRFQKGYWKCCSNNLRDFQKLFYMRRALREQLECNTLSFSQIMSIIINALNLTPLPDYEARENLIMTNRIF